MNKKDEIGILVTSTVPRADRQWRKLGRKLVEMLCSDSHYAPGSISEASLYPLIVIGRLGDGVRQNAVADEIGVEGPALVRLLDMLAEQKLIIRQEDPNDRRAKTLWLTDEGRILRQRIEDYLTVIRARMLRGHSQEELATALRVLQTIANCVEDGVFDEVVKDGGS